MTARATAKRRPARRRANPVPASSVESQVAQASRLYKRFSGMDVELAEWVNRPPQPDVLVLVGEIDFVGYTTIRDGVVEKYIHRFKSKARPLFCVTPDGSSIVLLGGAYDFTERGIVDQVD